MTTDSPATVAGPATGPAAIWNVPYQRNTHFTGRGQLLAQLRETLKAAHEPASRVQVLCGLGGIGKTQTALEYAYRHRWDYSIIWWVSADDPVTLGMKYAELGRRLGLKFGIETSLHDIRHVVRRVLSQRSDWLVVFDNAPGPDAVRDYLPLGNAGHAIVTSRHQAWGAVGRSRLVTELARNDSVAFLRKRTGRTDSADSAKRLAQALGDLPLALEQAAAVIDGAKISFEDYLARFESHWAELLQQGRPSTEYPDSVAMAWELSFRQVEERSEAAAGLLTFVSFLAAEPVGDVILAAAAAWVPPGLQTTLGDKDGLLARAVETLREFSLIEQTDKGLVAHRLVSALTRTRHGLESRKAWAAGAVGTMASLFDFNSADVSTWARCAELLPHAVAAADHAVAADASPAAAAALYDVAGRYLLRVAQFDPAREAFVKALRVYDNYNGGTHPRIAGISNNLGRLFTRLGDHATARVHLERALAMDQQSYGPDDPHVATIANNYGKVLHANGDVPAAKAQFEHALRVFTGHYGADHPKTATVLNNLAYAEHCAGNTAAAVEQLERALDMTERAYGPDHPQVASILCNLAMVRLAQGQSTAARDLLDRALGLDMRAYGPTHPDVARDLEALAELHEAQDDPAGAREALERALTIDEAVYGPTHRLLARRLGALVRVCGKLADPAADRYRQRLQSIATDARSLTNGSATRSHAVEDDPAGGFVN